MFFRFSIVINVKETTGVRNQARLVSFKQLVSNFIFSWVAIESYLVFYTLNNNHCDFASNKSVNSAITAATSNRIDRIFCFIYENIRYNK